MSEETHKAPTAEQRIPRCLRSAINILTPFTFFGVPFTVIGIPGMFILQELSPAARTVWITAGVAGCAIVAVAVTRWEDKLTGTPRQHYLVFIVQVLILGLLLAIWLPALRS